MEGVNMDSTEQDVLPKPAFCRACAAPLTDGQCRKCRRRYRILYALLLGVSVLVGAAWIYVGVLRLR